MKQVYKSKYGISVLFKPLLLLLILPFIYGVLEPERFWDSLYMLEGMVLVYLLPLEYLNYQYWRNDSNQVVEIDSARGIVSISKKELTSQFYLNEVMSCDFVNVRPFTKRWWSNYAYLRIKTADDTFIITHFTIRPEKLLNELSIPYEDIEVFFPYLDYKKITQKQKEKNQVYYEEKKEEFLSRYDDYEIGELLYIIKNREIYADYAVAAAYEILIKRKNSAVNKAWS